MELLIRAADADTRVIGDLCAPASAGLLSAPRLPLTGVVVDAPVAVHRPVFARTAHAAAVPYLVDPLTPLLTDEQAPDHPWARLPFATGQKVTPGELAHPGLQDDLVESVIAFQRDRGATWLIPPYLYAARLDDPAAELNLQLLTRTARYLDRERISLPVVLVFAASLMAFGPQATWAGGLDRFIEAAEALTHLRYVALSWSTSSPGNESYQKLAHLLTATEHAATLAHVLSWRQGLYGLPLVACGAVGYETGAGRLERAHYPDLMATRRPKVASADDDEDDFRSTKFVYLSPLGRSVPKAVALELFKEPALEASLVCLHPETCCADGSSSMTSDWRDHAIRERSRELRKMEGIPASRGWRLNNAASLAGRAHTVARDANRVLSATKLPNRLPEKTFGNLAQVLGTMLDRGQSRVA